MPGELTDIFTCHRCGKIQHQAVKEGAVRIDRPPHWCMIQFHGGSDPKVSSVEVCGSCMTDIRRFVDKAPPRSSMAKE